MSLNARYPASPATAAAPSRPNPTDEVGRSRASRAEAAAWPSAVSPTENWRAALYEALNKTSLDSVAGCAPAAPPAGTATPRRRWAAMPIARQIFAGHQFLILAALVLVMGAVTGYVEGTRAAFNDQVSISSTSFKSGYLQFSFQDQGGGALANGFIAVAGLVPGDTIVRNIKLVNSAGTSKLPYTYKLSTSQTDAANALTTDTSNGLKLKVERCDSTWATCSVVSGANNVPVVQSNLAMGGPTANATGLGIDGLALNDTDYLRITLTLPSTAGSASNVPSFQGKTATIRFAWTAAA